MTDAAGLAYVCPSCGAVYADKGYCGRDAIETLEANGCHDATIERDNMKIGDRDKDGRISRMRSPYERLLEIAEPEALPQAGQGAVPGRGVRGRA